MSEIRGTLEEMFRLGAEDAEEDGRCAMMIEGNDDLILDQAHYRINTLSRYGYVREDNSLSMVSVAAYVRGYKSVNGEAENNEAMDDSGVRTHDDRVAYMDNVIFVYSEASGNENDDAEEIATDLLTDLWHWCRASGVDRDAVQRMAAMNFEAEIEEEEGG